MSRPTDMGYRGTQWMGSEKTERLFSNTVPLQPREREGQFYCPSGYYKTRAGWFLEPSVELVPTVEQIAQVRGRGMRGPAVRIARP